MLHLAGKRQFWARTRRHRRRRRRRLTCVPTVRSPVRPKPTFSNSRPRPPTASAGLGASLLPSLSLLLPSFLPSSVCLLAFGRPQAAPECALPLPSVAAGECAWAAARGLPLPPPYSLARPACSSSSSRPRSLVRTGFLTSDRRGIMAPCFRKKTRRTPKRIS